MTLYITRHALTQGIIEVDGDVSTEFPSMAVYNGINCCIRLHKPDWHTDKRDAIARASQMLKMKQSSLVRQMEKLNRLMGDKEWPPIVRVEQ